MIVINHLLCLWPTSIILDWAASCIISYARMRCGGRDLRPRPLYPAPFPELYMKFPHIWKTSVWKNYSGRQVKLLIQVSWFSHFLQIPNNICFSPEPRTFDHHALRLAPGRQPDCAALLCCQLPPAWAAAPASVLQTTREYSPEEDWNHQKHSQCCGKVRLTEILPMTTNFMSLCSMLVAGQFLMWKQRSFSFCEELWTRKLTLSTRKELTGLDRAELC